MRSFVEFVSESFIWAAGITRPKPGKERTAAVFITVALFGVLLGVVAAFFLLLNQFS